jgi:hypothetical protein
VDLHAGGWRQLVALRYPADLMPPRQRLWAGRENEIEGWQHRERSVILRCKTGSSGILTHA